MQFASARKKKVVVASSIAIPVDELLQAEAVKSGLTTSSLIRLFIHDGLQRRGVVLPEEAEAVTDDENGEAAVGTEGK